MTNVLSSFWAVSAEQRVVRVLCIAMFTFYVVRLPLLYRHLYPTP